MNEDLILSNLTPIAEEFGVTIDLTIRDSHLFVFVNRPSDNHPDYFILTKKVAEAIADLPFISINGIFFHSRQIGTNDPDWSNYLDLSPIPEIDCDATFLQEDEDNSALDLSQYSFIPNKALLDAEIIQPPPEIGILVLQLHQLSPLEKLQFSSILQQGIGSLKNSQFIPNKPVKDLLENITNLSEENQQKALTWISLYCANPQETIAKIDVQIEEENRELYLEYDLKEFLVDDSELSDAMATVGATRATYHHPRQQETDLDTYSSPSRSKIPWIILLTVFILMVVGTVLNSDSAAQICANSSSPYCKLAVQIAGSKTIQEEAKDGFPITPELASEFQSFCISRGYIKAGLALKTLTQGTVRTPMSSGEEILTGIYVADLKQGNYNTETVSERVACIFKARQISQPREEPQIKLIAAEIIPKNWPEKPYKRPINSPDDLEDTLGIFGILTVLLTSTLFTAFGIILANKTGLGIQVNKIKTAIESSLFLGILETIFVFIPFANFFLSLVLGAMALLITSWVIKGFKIDWASGYRVVLFGAAIIIGTRMILNFLLISLISAII